MKKVIFSSLFAFSVMSSTAFAETALCQIDKGESMLYKGQCDLQTQGKNSFYLTGDSLKRNTGTDVIKVLTVDSNKTVVTVTKPNGDTINWGTASRSNKQKACWLGDNDSFKVCAW